jgi:hypothetical protein
MPFSGGGRDLRAVGTAEVRHIPIHRHSFQQCFAPISVSMCSKQKCRGVSAACNLRNLASSLLPRITRGNTAGLIRRIGLPAGPTCQAMLAFGVVCPGRTIARGSLGSSFLRSETSQAYRATSSAASLPLKLLTLVSGWVRRTSRQVAQLNPIYSAVPIVRLLRRRTTRCLPSPPLGIEELLFEYCDPNVRCVQLMAQEFSCIESGFGFKGKRLHGCNLLAEAVYLHGPA